LRRRTSTRTRARRRTETNWTARNSIPRRTILRRRTSTKTSARRRTETNWTARNSIPRRTILRRRTATRTRARRRTATNWNARNSTPRRTILRRRTATKTSARRTTPTNWTAKNSTSRRTKSKMTMTIPRPTVPPAEGSSAWSPASQPPPGISRGAPRFSFPARLPASWSWSLSRVWELCAWASPPAWHQPRRKRSPVLELSGPASRTLKRFSREFSPCSQRLVLMRRSSFLPSQFHDAKAARRVGDRLLRASSVSFRRLLIDCDS